MPVEFDALLPRLRFRRAVLDEAGYARFDAVLQVVAGDEAGGAAPGAGVFSAARRRRGKAAGEAPLVVTLAGGTAVARLSLAAGESGDAAEGDVFGRQERVRAALAPLLALAPRSLAVDVRAAGAAAEVVYAVLVAAAVLPAERAVADARAAPAVTFAGTAGGGAVGRAVCAARANALARALTQLPPNALPPAVFASLAKSLARRFGLTVRVMSAAQLQKAGAGAFCAVGRAADDPPLLLRLSYSPKNETRAAARRRVALVGKGVCYDTGGVNVKPARYMRGMGCDMAGAAVALASVLAAAELRLPVGVDAWLALAENSIAPNAYRPDDVVTAANGRRIEVVHSDAEGRMLLADALTFASRLKPAGIVTYATLTGTMCTALGSRMSGFFASGEEGRRRALAAAAASGERLCYFPMPADYREGLKSEVADVKQCAEEGDADHILAALFLREFIEGTPAWLHLDLSAAVCKGGLGAAPGRVTGFGVAWTLALLAGGGFG